MISSHYHYYDGRLGSVPDSVSQSRFWLDLLNRSHVVFFIMITLVVISRHDGLVILPSHDWVVHKIGTLFRALPIR